jgi:hypothetical protein
VRGVPLAIKAKSKQEPLRSISRDHCRAAHAAVFRTGSGLVSFFEWQLKWQQIRRTANIMLPGLLVGVTMGLKLLLCFLSLSYPLKGLTVEFTFTYMDVAQQSGLLEGSHTYLLMSCALSCLLFLRMQAGPVLFAIVCVCKGTECMHTRNVSCSN